jgi:hypothetical protein
LSRPRITGVEATKPKEIRVGTSLVVGFITVGEGKQAKTYLAFNTQLNDL